MPCNAAIIIAVNDYVGELSPLPGCVSDGEALKALISGVEKYDKLLILNNNERSSTVKQKIAEFIVSLQAGAIEELLFYFTGHGVYVEDEFFYCLPDFRMQRKNSTALTNSELDNLVRSVNPEIFVKVVDACQSGVAYIKGKDEFEEFIKGKKSGFRKLYFFFSSNSQQSSYQSNRISDFTEAFIEAVATHAEDRIRYPDVMSFVSDKFEGTSKQTPYFVTQADFTEVFCSISDDLRDSLKPFLSFLPSNTMLDPNKGDLVARIKAAAANFGTKDDAIRAAELILSFSKAYTFNDTISELYDISVSSEDDYPPRAFQIGKWLNENKTYVIFAKPTFKQEAYTDRVLKNPLLPNLRAISGIYDEDDSFKTVIRHRNVVDGYENSSGIPYNYVRVNLDPKVLSVGPERLYLAILASRTTIYIAKRTSSLEYSGWDNTRLKTSSDWQTITTPITDHSAIESVLTDIFNDAQTQIVESLRSTFATPLAEIGSEGDNPSEKSSDSISKQKRKPSAAGGLETSSKA